MFLKAGTLQADSREKLVSCKRYIYIYMFESLLHVCKSCLGCTECKHDVDMNHTYTHTPTAFPIVTVQDIVLRSFFPLSYLVECCSNAGVLQIGS